MEQRLIRLIFLLHISCAFGIRISQKKCQEYETLVPSVFQNNSEGSSENADPSEFPFLVKIFDYPTRYFNGLLISDNFVLTHSHIDSIRHPDVDPFVVLGDYVNRTDVAHQRFSIVQYVASPQNDPHNPDKLTLLKLNGSVKFNQHVRPVCLSQPEDIIVQPLFEVSWGYEDLLRKQERDLLSNKMCDDAHKDNPMVPTRMCACRKEDDCKRGPVTDAKLKYACALLNGRRETASPNELLAVKRETAQYTCTKQYPEEYVRISAYIDWIETTVWPEQKKSGVSGRANYFTLYTYIFPLIALFQINLSV